MPRPVELSMMAKTSHRLPRPVQTTEGRPSQARRCISMSTRSLETGA
ncbi:hypothetical protein CORC01_09359 [Colletotrichum orchidophilum]|uniref:Uncharacterized protein n=1 Tax=Colletotrichum orchidophilum TaxID=1209926 RepID=A0A1G4B1Q2_9PEZI|nr:uncharacterized protein CORC01_09359 [Colletotrichum orchidophilum]OHE95348.1 hypothetical protein CORC01_09359 [Colletotrichum orchidophilum]